MLPAAHRMRRRTEFAAAIRAGRRAARGGLVLHLALDAPAPDDRRGVAPGSPVLPTSGRPAHGPAIPTEPTSAGSSAAPARVGFVVPRAVGSAVDRNLVRRRLRHLVRDRIGQLPPGAALVVRVLPPAAGASSRVLAEQLDTALARALEPAGRAPRRRP